MFADAATSVEFLGGVKVELKVEDKDFSVSIIHPRWMITAAHDGLGKLREFAREVNKLVAFVEATPP